MLIRLIQCINTLLLLAIVMINAFNKTSIEESETVTITATYNTGLEMCRRAAMLCATAWVLCVSVDKQRSVDRILTMVGLTILSAGCVALTVATLPGIWMTFVALFTLQTVTLLIVSMYALIVGPVHLPIGNLKHIEVPTTYTL